MPIVEESLFYSASDGLRLHVRSTRNEGEARDLLPVVCLSGLSRNHRDFDAVARIIATETGRQVYAFDYRGRGLSAYDADWQNYTLLNEANDVLAGLIALGIGHAHFIGTSRGGLIIHLLAGMRPGAMASVTLNDVGPVVGGAGMAQIKLGLNSVPKLSTWAEAERYVSQVNAKAFPALKADDFARMARAIFVEDKKAGTIKPDYDPALLNTLKSFDFDTPLPTLWPQFAGLKSHSLLVLRGENSQLLTAETLEAMHKVAAKMISHTVAGQGHVPLLETSDVPKRLIAHFAKAEQGLAH
jgi:pimeloyl-ACP methyl ester carboxylesterase